MSLRARLTLLYTTLLGVILLIFGASIYGLVSYLLVNQIDETLIQTFGVIRENTTVEEVGNLNVITLPSPDLKSEVFTQAWSRDGVLQASNIEQLDSPLDPTGLSSPVPIFRDVTLDNVHLRVLTVPLQIGERPIGTLQMAANLAVVDTTQRALVTVLLVGSIICLGVAAIAGWLSTGQALAPLERVTETALQITRADDLSRRIPYQGYADDEVGKLIQAFNQTLSRLENLFNTQRRFIVDVGHELRTPLTVIKGNVDLMRRMGCSDEESIVGIESEVDRLTRLVGDLLLLA
ncbi:MAG: HAMP domain-containing protein, partial [Anaerolineales bacterium]|nr:HAMP domain-containing protein [Anaerolineales bacterium]